LTGAAGVGIMAGTSGVRPMNHAPGTSPRECYRKKHRPGAGPDDEPDPRPDDDAEAHEERAILCRGCGAPITSREAALEVDGAHEHTFFNPAGIVYRIGCFARAGGCVDTGAWTDEFAWFPGHQWRFSLCAGCGAHLGWQFGSAAGAEFWGLILERLEER
jgi:hypothetical protein